MSVESTLSERGNRYGDFSDHAVISQRLQDTMRDAQGWQKLSDDKKQALSVIADKIARILNGDPEYKDNWHDIQGYAKLAEDRCLDAQQQAPALPPGWIPWFGGDCPVSPNTKVQTMLRSENFDNLDDRITLAENYRWDRSRNECEAVDDVVAYRVVEVDPYAHADGSRECRPVNTSNDWIDWPDNNTPVKILRHNGEQEEGFIYSFDWSNPDKFKRIRCFRVA